MPDHARQPRHAGRHRDTLDELAPRRSVEMLHRPNPPQVVISLGRTTHRTCFSAIGKLRSPAPLVYRVTWGYSPLRSSSRSLPGPRWMAVEIRIWAESNQPQTACLRL